MPPYREEPMKSSMLSALALICAVATAHAQNLSPDDLARRTFERRAVEAVNWGMPLVNTDAMRQAYFPAVGAKYNSIWFFSQPAAWAFQGSTPHSSTNYVYFNFHLQERPGL